MTSVPGRSGKADKDWLKARGTAFTSRVKIATLDPFHGYKNAIDDQLEDAVAVLDAFLPRKREVPPVVKLGAKAVDDMRRRIQTDIHGHRGRKGDPLYRIRNALRAGEENLTDRQRERLASVWESDERHVAVEVAWACSQQLRSVYHQPTHAAGRIIAERIIDTFHTCPIPEVARLDRTLRQWREAFLGYFETAGANNGDTEAINGLIELHRRVARGFRNLDNYRLRMLLIAGGLKL
jgi:transposase